MSHRPRKRFGQNFLQNPHIIDNILKAINLRPDDKVVEIGPGLGALTLPLLKMVHQLVAIEIDTDLQAYLSQLPAAKGKLTIIPADALMVDYNQWGSSLRVVGNLPYNISTPLLLHLFHYVHNVADMHFMLQKEVVLRLAAAPGCKAYGRLSVITQYYCEVEHLFDVPAEAFHPQPKVESAIVRLIPYSLPPYPVNDITVLERVVAQAFSMRRKTLANNLKPLMNAGQITSLDIDPGARPEQIPVEQYVRIAKFINK